MLGGIGYNNTMDIRTLFKQDSRMLKDYLSFKLGCLKGCRSLWLSFPSISSFFSFYLHFIPVLIFTSIFATISSTSSILLI